MKTQILVGQVLKNKLSNGAEIVVRVLALNVAGTDMVRVCDNREMLPDAKLIKNNKTWAAPIANLIDDAETKALTDKAFEIVGHKDQLIHCGF
jgi:hypothetical protein